MASNRIRQPRAERMGTLGDALKGTLARWQREGRIHALPDPCDRCGNSGFVRGAQHTIGLTVYCACGWGTQQRKRDEKARADMRDSILANRNETLARSLKLPERHRVFTLDSHPLAGTPIHTGILAWLANWNGERGLILRGAYGTGKTGLVVGMLKAMMPRAAVCGWEMRFITSLDLFTALQAGFRDESYADVLDEYSSVHVLALDDLCAERATDWRQDQLLAILNARYNASLPLLATTNCDDAQLRERLTERVYWRLIETCDVLAVSGVNLREPGRGQP